MFFIFKKVLLIIILINIISIPKIVSASSHPDFKRIIFPYETTAQLIEDMEQFRIDNAYKKIKRKVFGWGVCGIIYDENVKYIGDTVFSKANNTTNTLTFIYEYQVDKEVETSISVTGDLGISGNAKNAKLSGGLEAAVRATIGKKTKYSVNEMTRTTLIIPKKSKISVIIKGDAVLNNGVARYFFFGIPFKKGTWEYIEVQTEYYDYYEEKI